MPVKRTHETKKAFNGEFLVVLIDLHVVNGEPTVSQTGRPCLLHTIVRGSIKVVLMQLKSLRGLEMALQILKQLWRRARSYLSRFY
jgi:hypothetical protein